MRFPNWAYFSRCIDIIAAFFVLVSTLCGYKKEFKKPLKTVAVWSDSLRLVRWPSDW